MQKVSSVWVCLVLVSMLGPVALGAETAKGSLMKPESLDRQAPATFAVKFETPQGTFVIDVTRDWAPRGADRFYNLARNGFYDDIRVFRVVPNFVVQFGMSGDPKLSEVWQQARLKDDPVKTSNKAGSVSFATAGPNSRTTQVFINLRDNPRLDEGGFSPFGVVSEGMDVVAKMYAGYGDGPDQARIAAEGNAYLDEKVPQLDRVIKATVVETTEPASGE